MNDIHHILRDAHHTGELATSCPATAALLAWLALSVAMQPAERPTPGTPARGTPAPDGTPSRGPASTPASASASGSVPAPASGSVPVPAPAPAPVSAPEPDARPAASGAVGGAGSASGPLTAPPVPGAVRRRARIRPAGAVQRGTRR